MESRPADPAKNGERLLMAAGAVSEQPALKWLAFLAFLLLAVALCSRALLNEDRSIPEGQLLVLQARASSATLMARHVCHLVAAAGIGLAAVWVLFSRRTWRRTGLAVGALILIGAAGLSVSVASDKRLAMNSAIDTILPLMAGACLYQLLAHRVKWRVALLAVLVAVAAANSFKAASESWEKQKSWQQYQQNRASVWAKQNVNLDDPIVAAWEHASKTSRPSGFIQGANVFGSFVLLGLTVTCAAIASRRWWWHHRHEAGTVIWMKRLTLVMLSILIVVELLAMYWVRTAGSIAGFLATVAAVAILWRWQKRPMRLAVVLAGALLLIQGTLFALAMAPADWHRALLNTHALGNKVRTFGARLSYYQGATRLFIDHPLTGVGPSQFGKHFLAVRPVYSDEAPSNAHNWLFNLAAEWGILGLLGIATTVALCVWKILRGLALSRRDDLLIVPRPWLATTLVMLGCWLMVFLDLPSQQWAAVLPYPLAISVVMALLVAYGRPQDRIGQMILLAGIVGLLVHFTVEITPSVPGVMWPFWAVMALAMAWSEPDEVGDLTKLRSMAPTGPVLAIFIAIAVVLLTIQPMRSVSGMYRAQRAVVNGQPDRAVALFKEAATFDTLNPLPLKAAALMRFQKAEHTVGAQSLIELRDYLSLSQEAVQRNPADYSYWRSVALANMHLATQASDVAMVDDAIVAMQKALELNPRWLDGWVELARMAAVTGGEEAGEAARQRIGLEAVTHALNFDLSRRKERLASLSTREVIQLQTLGRQLQERLGRPTRP